MSSEKLLVATPKWMKKAQEIINSDQEYEELAKEINHTFTFYIKKEPQKGVEEDIIIGYKIEHGKMTDFWTEKRKTDFEISGPYSVWVKIFNNELGPIKALTMGRLRVKGSLPKLLKFNKATLRFVELLRRIPTKFHGQFGE